MEKDIPRPIKARYNNWFSTNQRFSYWKKQRRWISKNEKLQLPHNESYDTLWYIYKNMTQTIKY